MRPPKPLPTIETLRDHLDYDPATGVFLRRSVDQSRNKKRKSLCDRRHMRTVVLGYQVISIDSSIYKAHRIAWKMFYGVEPPLHIDHINGNTIDNRIDNLRAATAAQNQWNRIKNPSQRPYKGVWFDDSGGNKTNVWRSRITCNGRIIDVGRYPTPEEARDARMKILPVFHGEFANHG